MVHHMLFLVAYSESLGQNHLEYRISGLYLNLRGSYGLPNTLKTQIAGCVFPQGGFFKVL